MLKNQLTYAKTLNNKGEDFTYHTLRMMNAISSKLSDPMTTPSDTSLQMNELPFLQNLNILGFGFWLSDTDPN